MSSKFTWSGLKSLWKQAMQGMRIRRHLPPEYAEAFEEFKDIKSIDRIQVGSWIGFGLAIILIFGLDNYRRITGEFDEEKYNYTLFYFHLLMLLFIVPAIYIGKRKAWIIQTRLRRGVVIWGMVVFCFIAMLAQAATVYFYRDSLNIFIGFIFTASWMFAMSHRERLLFFSVSLSVMAFFILKKEFNDHSNKTLVNAIEVTFFSIIAFFFDAFDYNLRVTNFLNQLQIESEQKRVRELEGFKARFFTNLTHEFRTPLTIIIGMAREIADQPNRWAAEGSQMIRHHAGNLLNLINQILDLSRLENSSMPMKLVQSDIIPFLSVIVDAYKGQAVLKGITVHFLPPPQPIVMDFDPDKMVTIAANLLSNAIKFTPEDGNIYVSVYLQRLDSHEEQLSIVIKDSGIGIPEAELEHIFERFYQVPGELSKAGMGTGIGLALSKELAHLLGGDIAVMSTMGKGSQFTIHLPVHRNAAITSVMAPVVEDNIVQAIHPNHTIINAADESDFVKPELLIIEDHADIVAYLQICLRDMFSISISRNGEEGIQKALEIVPSIIISDVLMPGKDGLFVCRELKSNAITSHIVGENRYCIAHCRPGKRS
jgi:signal transduction histidine kinase